MRRTRFDEWPCPIARATDLLGDWWTPLVLRELFRGHTRFDDIAQQLDLPRAVLTARLKRLEAEAVVTRVAYCDRPVRYEYQLTEKGVALGDVLLAMWQWGSDWGWSEGDGPEFELRDAERRRVVPRVVDERTGSRLAMAALRLGRARTA
jgi:DNA-binding HxlR family transcriptional regulator